MLKVQAQRKEGENWDTWVGYDELRDRHISIAAGETAEFEPPVPAAVEQGIESGHLVVIETEE